MPAPNSAVTRGDIWTVRFDPSEGDEIRKIRPAIVMSIKQAGRLELHIVVPITEWQPQFSKYFWMILLLPTSTNGLSKESAADAFQIKSVSANRFQTKLGVVTPGEIDRIATAIVFCIGYNVPNPSQAATTS
jgi:mRNA interferase MazF